MPRVFFHMMLFIKLRGFGKCSGISFADSTMIPVCHNLRRHANKVFKGVVTDGKGTMGWGHGVKLHLLCNDSGEIINSASQVRTWLTGTNWCGLSRPGNFYGKVFADRGYIKQELFESLFDRGIHLVHGLRANMKNKLMSMRDKIMLRKRSIIECINDLLKNKAGIVHSRHRSIRNFIMNICAALTAYSFFENKPEALRCMWKERPN